MKTKRLSNKDVLRKKVFSSLENSQQNGQKNFKLIKPHKQDEKENWDSHVFISSTYNAKMNTNYNTCDKPIKVVRQTFTTNNEKTEVTHDRPTMGGKTVSSMSLSIKSKTMSSKELKLLSRRINPNEPLSSPHASPTKPPLPVIKKRKPKKIIKSYQFTCEPCNKIYKTRAGFIYHKEKCKYQKHANVIINCTCEQPTQDIGTMIECITCHQWLHLKCAGDVVVEENYSCSRCIHDITQILMTSTSTPAPTTTTTINTNIFNDDFWTSNSEEIPIEFNSSDFCNNEDLPSLLFSDNNPSSSFLEDNIPSSPQQLDWYHFANFEHDFQL